VSPAPFAFRGRDLAPGTRHHFELPVGRLPSGAEVHVPIDVLHGATDGPTIWLSGAIHGDEIVGVEIIRRALEAVDETALGGTIVAVPVVNVFGFAAESRYLPDRRDLNRSFPGSRHGSLASQLARLFLDEVVRLCELGIDFHAGSGDRTNLSQIRCNMDDEETRRLALAFGAPVAIHSRPVKGTLRNTALRMGKRCLLFEGGEPRRFNPRAVESGATGTLRVLGALGMIESPPPPPQFPTRESRSTHWVRASRGGIFRLESRLGTQVERGQRLGVISGPSGREAKEVRARVAGIVLGHAVSPLVHRGDALVHIAELI
jgi:hypothetical protein